MLPPPRFQSLSSLLCYCESPPGLPSLPGQILPCPFLYCTPSLLSSSTEGDAIKMQVRSCHSSAQRLHRLCISSWVRKIRWRRDRLPTPVFLGFSCDSAGKEFACNARDLGSIPGLGRSPGEGKGYPLQYSGLENSMDCIVQGVAQSCTCLSDFSFHLEVKEALQTRNMGYRKPFVHKRDLMGLSYF